MNRLKLPVFGVDIGGVLIRRCDDDADTSFFGKNYLKTPEVGGGFEVLRKLNDCGVTIHLVSKCGANTQAKTLEWLDYHEFYARTGTLRENIHFCRERHQKAGICKSISASHFVDDRLEILSYLDTVPYRYLINSVEQEVSRYRRALNMVSVVEDWMDLKRLFDQSLAQVFSADSLV